MSTTTPKFCAECGAALQGAKFCPECGHKTAAAPAPAAAPDKAAEPAPAPVKAAAPVAKAAEPVALDPLASILNARDDDDDDHHDDSLGQPAQEQAPEKKPLPMGWIAMGGLAAVLLGIVGWVASNDEMSARFQCSVLGKKEKCITEEDRQWEIEQAEKREEMELMAHHYGSFDLGFTPETETSVTIVQKRYEEPRADFVKRIRDGEGDARTFKEKKTGVYTQGKSADGQTKGLIAFKADGSGVTWQPTQGKELLLPMSLQNLALLEREQVQVGGNADGSDRRLTADDVKKLETEAPAKDAEGKTIPKKKVKTTDVSTWIYEVELTAPGYETRKVLFYEHPAPPDVDLKKLEADDWTVRKFSRTPDGKFVVPAGASFDLAPKPRTIQTRYIQLLKELHCLRQSKEYQGKTEQGKKDAEDLIWEQKQLHIVREICEQNEATVAGADPEVAKRAAAAQAEDPKLLEDFAKLKETEFKGYVCPKMAE